MSRDSKLKAAFRGHLEREGRLPKVVCMDNGPVFGNMPYHGKAKAAEKLFKPLSSRAGRA